ncbi:cyclin-dependent kinase 4 inhibitor C isoform X2 [Columba livia]|uniref:cyclin-dependent kinase 4 inhibitor C isoform X2 n=1 Tax=Columba livia TaxID=8932 RepID=UPI0028C0AE51|nr:Cdkn2c [Columba livia]
MLKKGGAQSREQRQRPRTGKCSFTWRSRKRRRAAVTARRDLRARPGRGRGRGGTSATPPAAPPLPGSRPPGPRTRRPPGCSGAAAAGRDRARPLRGGCAGPREWSRCGEREHRGSELGGRGSAPCLPRARLVLLVPSGPGLEAAVWDGRGDPEREWMHTATEDFSSELLLLKSQIPTANRVMKLGNPEIARRLLAHGANPDLRDSTGFAVMHDVAREGFPDTLQALLEFQADVNVQDSEGNLPLHLAAREGHARVVELLLARAECRVGHQNVRGATAYDLAKLYKRHAVVQLLERGRRSPAGAD